VPSSDDFLCFNLFLLLVAAFESFLLMLLTPVRLKTELFLVFLEGTATDFFGSFQLLERQVAKSSFGLLQERHFSSGGFLKLC